MKNIHILPTERPSRLLYDKDDNLLFAPNLGWDMAYGKQHIYITNDEDIKERDYFLYDGRKIRYKSNGTEYHGRDLCHISGNRRYPVSKSKKIILTTDLDLISDCIQAIDDEFLEWFVKNPTCERIEVDKIPDLQSYNEKTNNCELVYVIIIPKEEPKHQTIEQAAKNYSEIFSLDGGHRSYAGQGFIDGAKSDAARDYWYKKFWEDYESKFKNQTNEQ